MALSARSESLRRLPSAGCVCAAFYNLACRSASVAEALVSCLVQGGEIVCRHAGLFRQTADALGASVGLLFQIAQLVFGAGDGREGFVALAYRGVQLTLRGLYLGLQAGERCGSLGVLLLQSGKSLCRRAGLFLQTGEALGGGVGLLFQIAQLVFGVGDGREGFVALAYRGVQLTLRGLYLGLQAGERCGSLGVLLLQSGKIFCPRAGLFLQTGEALGGGVGLLFQIAQLVFGVGDGREGFVALAYRGVQLTLRGLYLGLQAGERCGSLGVLLLQSGKSWRQEPRRFATAPP